MQSAFEVVASMVDGTGSGGFKLEDVYEKHNKKSPAIADRA
jgi:hypothetical protein